MKQVISLYNSKAYQALIFNIASKYSGSLKQILQGKKSDKKILKQIYGAAKMNHIFEYEFKESIYKLNVFEKLSNEDIYWTIKNSLGINQGD